MSDFPGESVTEVYGSTLFALRGGGWGSNFEGKVLRNTSPEIAEGLHEMIPSTRRRKPLAWSYGENDTSS